MDHIPTDNRAIASEPTTIGRNFMWMSWSGVVSIANSLLVWMFMARMRDVEEVGQFAIVMGLYALFFGIVALGLPPYLLNEISLRRTLPDATESITRFVSSAAVFLSLSGLAAAMLMTAAAFAISNSWEVRAATMVLSLAMIPSGFDAVAESTAIAFGRARQVAIVSTIENVLRTAVPLILILNGYSLVWIAASFVSVRFVAAGVYLWLGREHLSRFSFVPAEFRAIFRATPTFAGTIIFATLNWQMPLVLLGYIAVEAEIAKFGTAARFLIPVSILMGSYASTVHPSLVLKFREGPYESGRYMVKVLCYPMLAAIVAISCSFAFGDQLLTLLFGEAYGAGALPLTILAISSIPFCIVMITARGLVASGLQRIDLYANIIGVVACIAIGSMIVPIYGAAGAAASQLISFSLMAVIEMAILTKVLGGMRVVRSVTASVAGILRIDLWNR